MQKIGLIAGSGFEALFPVADSPARYLTSAGRFDYYVYTLDGLDILVVPRHGTDHSLPPHRIPSMAQLIGLVELGAEKVVAMSAVGSADERFSIGDIIIPDQFIDLTKSRKSTFYDHAAVHTDMTVPFCPQLRSTLLAAFGVGDHPFRVHDGGTYACTEGPRYETPAEVHMIRTLGGQLIGSSAGPEIALARELGLCYALVTMVANLGAGYQQRVDSRDILETIWSNSPQISPNLTTALLEAAGSSVAPPCTDNAFEAGRLRARLRQRI